MMCLGFQNVVPRANRIFASRSMCNGSNSNLRYSLLFNPLGSWKEVKNNIDSDDISIIIVVVVKNYFLILLLLLLLSLLLIIIIIIIIIIIYIIIAAIQYLTSMNKGMVVNCGGHRG